MNVQNNIGKFYFIKVMIPLIGLCMIMGSGLTFAQGIPGAVVDPMKLMTSTAAQDPARPEMARVIATAFKSLGWSVAPYPIQYNQSVQKVIMEQDYDMWLLIHGGSPRRIDPHPYIFKKNHSESRKKGNWNWEGSFDPVVDKLGEAQRLATDMETRKQIVYLAQNLIHENQFYNVVANVQQTNAYRSDRIKSLVPMVGEGIGSFWTDINMEVIQGDGYVRTGSGSSLKTLNPIAVVDQLELMEVRMFYDRLFRINPEGKPVPWAAESYKVINSTTFEVTLRKGMKFHDGVDITVEDVKFSFDYAKKWKAPAFVEPLRLLDSVEITGKHVVRFNINKPAANFVNNLLANIFIIPKHIWENIPEKVDVDDPLKYTNEKPVGSGPFKVDYWDRGRELKVSSVKEHFNAPKVDGIIRMVYGSHEALVAAIEKGECDRTRYILKPNYIKKLQKNKNIVAKGYPNHGFYCLSYNAVRPPLDDRNFRRALAHVIPKELICDVILSGLAKPGSSVIAPANKFWNNPDVKPFPEDVEKAKKILADAGYFWDNKGKLHYPKK